MTDSQVPAISPVGQANAMVKTTLERLGSHTITLEQAQAISKAAFLAAGQARAPMTAEALGAIIDFAKVTRPQAKLLAVRLLKEGGEDMNTMVHVSEVLQWFSIGCAAGAAVMLVALLPFLNFKKRDPGDDDGDEEIVDEQWLRTELQAMTGHAARSAMINGHARAGHPAFLQGSPETQPEPGIYSREEFTAAMSDAYARAIARRHGTSA